MLKSRDFAQMSAAEIARAKQLIAELRLPDDTVPTRRFQAAHQGARIDPRRTFRRSLRGGGASIDLAFRERAQVHPPVVALVDISGSMAEYSRIFLHFLHALDRQAPARALLRLRHAADQRHAHRCARAIPTRRWRLPAGPRRTGRAARASRPRCTRSTGSGRAACWRAGRSCCSSPTGWSGISTTSSASRWTGCSAPAGNWSGSTRCCAIEGFEARASGIRAMLPHVDSFRPIHNLAAMADLCAALSPDAERQSDPRLWLKKAVMRHDLVFVRRHCERSEAIQRAARPWIASLRSAMTGAAWRLTGGRHDQHRHRHPRHRRKLGPDGRGVALATVVETWGSAPRPVGSHLVIDGEGNFLGSVSGGCVEGAVVDRGGRRDRRRQGADARIRRRRRDGLEGRALLRRAHQGLCGKGELMASWETLLAFATVTIARRLFPRPGAALHGGADDRPWPARRLHGDARHPSRLLCACLRRGLRPVGGVQACAGTLCRGEDRRRALPRLARHRHDPLAGSARPMRRVAAQDGEAGAASIPSSSRC